MEISQHLFVDKIYFARSYPGCQFMAQVFKPVDLSDKLDDVGRPDP